MPIRGQHAPPEFSFASAAGSWCRRHSEGPAPSTLLVGTFSKTIMNLADLLYKFQKCFHFLLKEIVSEKMCVFCRYLVRNIRNNVICRHQIGTESKYQPVVSFLSRQPHDDTGQRSQLTGDDSVPQLKEGQIEYEALLFASMLITYVPFCCHG